MKDLPRDPDAIVTTRRTLYDEVWEEPLVRVAKRYGVSGGWLGKLCDRRNIPRPDFGLWARSERVRAARPPLPPASDPANETLHISREWGERRERLQRMREDPEIARLLALDRSAAPFHVRSTLHGAHPLVRSGPLDGKRTRGRVADESLRVSEPHRRRALLIFDALLRGLDERGFDLRRRSGPRGPGLVVAVLGVEIRLVARDHLRATMRTSRHRPGWFHAGLEGHGELELHARVPGGAKRCWRETPSRGLEQRLASVPSALIEPAQAEVERTTNEGSPRARRRR
ncbi:MAG: hypothetical protein IT574_03010 [Candidatus Aureabacteria bacterium]|nr:hypothetical protein [Candidatus Auribacterota bacterium]